MDTLTACYSFKLGNYINVTDKFSVYVTSADLVHTKKVKSRSIVDSLL